LLVYLFSLGLSHPLWFQCISKLVSKVTDFLKIYPECYTTEDPPVPPRVNPIDVMKLMNKRDAPLRGNNKTLTLSSSSIQPKQPACLPPMDIMQQMFMNYMQNAGNGEIPMIYPRRGAPKASMRSLTSGSLQALGDAEGDPIGAPGLQDVPDVSELPAGVLVARPQAVNPSMAASGKRIQAIMAMAGDALASKPPRPKVQRTSTGRSRRKAVDDDSEDSEAAEAAETGNHRDGATAASAAAATTAQASVQPPSRRLGKKTDRLREVPVPTTAVVGHPPCPPKGSMSPRTYKKARIFTVSAGAWRVMPIPGSRYEKYFNFTSSPREEVWKDVINYVNDTSLHGPKKKKS